MNGRKLAKLGVPAECIKEAIVLVQEIAKHNRTVEKEDRLDIKDTIKAAISPHTALKPEEMAPKEESGYEFPYEEAYHDFAKAVAEDRAFVRPEPISYTEFGAEGIDDNSRHQMENACRMPNATAAALMPDAHLGYGLPIGGVLALENAVCPFAVGMDIACRMKLSILDMEPETLKTKKNLFEEALKLKTAFGMGICHDKSQEHAVLDQDWEVTKVTREQKDKAREQLGSSGSGNHFVEFGVVTLGDDFRELYGLPNKKYVALMSHSGSRKAGYMVCKKYSSIAQQRLPRKYEDLGELAWLDMDTEAGQEYWAAMNLMGDYAAANHDVIHRLVIGHVGAGRIAGVENHHNFAWKETHGGKEVYVHRKGATPAAERDMGVIPGSMEQPAYIVMGKGNAASLNSASHGAGRQLSRTQGKNKYSRNAVRNDLLKKGITVLGMGADESPGCYKPINEVMERQTELVDILGRFQPKIVMMDNSGQREVD